MGGAAGTNRIVGGRLCFWAGGSVRAAAAMGGGATRLPKARPVPGDQNPPGDALTRASRRTAHAQGNLRESGRGSEM